MDPIVSFRLASTGAWGYRFFEGRQYLGAVSCALMPNATVRIEAPGISWYSPFNMDNTIVPGISRRVKENSSGEEVFRIVYCQPGYYRMIPSQTQSVGGILVERREGAYLFGNQGMPVMAMTERIEEWPWRPPDAVPYFITRFFEEQVSREFLSAVLSFPALRFY